MPVEPPPDHALASFDPVFVTDEDIADLATFTGLSHEGCLRRLRSYSPAELAQAWRDADPKTPDEIRRFYVSTDLYIWELMQWHASPARGPYWKALSWFAKTRLPDDGWRRVLDFGCGVGTDALFLASRGYDATVVDVPGPTLDFAKHRFARRAISARFVESDSHLPELDGTYDVTVCFDVFEHLADPLAAARRLVQCLRERGVLLQVGQFGDDGQRPCLLREGVNKFGGLRWRAYLAGLGLRTVGPSAYERASRLSRMIQRARYALWRATGLWIVVMERP